MESLLISLTNTSIKDIEKNDFRVESYTINSNKRLDECSQDDEEEEVEEDDDDDDSSPDDDDSTDSFSNHHHHHQDMEQTIANLDLSDYDSIKYTGNSAGLQLLDQSLFKSKSYLQWPGREDVALRLMSQNELLVVRSDRSASGKKNKIDTIRLDVGFSLSSSIFDNQDNQQVTIPPTKPSDMPSDSLIQKAYHLCVLSTFCLYCLY
jgi:G3E family GTPase